ncbi:MAG: hypothetical protein LBL48_09020 [Azoarcus sp.]|nr:hypothetical protein [Azoarcus sp.]
MVMKLTKIERGNPSNPGQKIGGLYPMAFYGLDGDWDTQRNGLRWPEPRYNGLFAASYAREHVSRYQFGEGRCAHYVYEAITNGGGLKTLRRMAKAKDYGFQLSVAGFIRLLSPHHPETMWRVGMIAVIQAYPGGNSAGHICIWDSASWISDFVQTGGRDGYYPGPGYRQYRPAVEFFVWYGHF